MVRVKICGITSLEDALFALEAGADALGFVFWEESQRAISVEKVSEIIRGLPPFVTTVGVFVNEGADVINAIVSETGLDAVQLHGGEPPELCREINSRVIKAFRVKGKKLLGQGIDKYRLSAYLLDTYADDAAGGTGKTFDWAAAKSAKKYGRIILSGGLNPDNVRDAIKAAGPYAVDVSSGVEKSPGIKDMKKLSSFIKRAKKP